MRLWWTNLVAVFPQPGARSAPRADGARHEGVAHGGRAIAGHRHHERRPDVESEVTRRPAELADVIEHEPSAGP